MSEQESDIDRAIRLQEEMLLSKKLGPKKKPLIQKKQQYFDSIEMCKNKLATDNANAEIDNSPKPHKKTDGGN